MNIILFYVGMDKRGGIIPELRNQSAALDEEGVRNRIASRVKEVARSRYGRNTVVNVYGCLPSPRNIGIMFLARLKGHRLVWTPIFHPLRRQIWRDSGLHRVMTLFDWVAPHLARITHAVVAETEEEEKFFQAMGAPRTVVIPPVVSTTYSRLLGEDRLAARTCLRVGDEPVVLLIAAHSPRRKGLDFASQVLKELQPQVPNVTFLVVGGGDPGPLSGQAGVRTTGWCTDELLLEAYRSADLLFVPSRYEQFSRATLEAWACELPVVVSDGVALASTAKQHEAGKVVSFGDVVTTARTLADTLQDPLWRRQAGERGRALVQRSYLKDRLRETAELYRSLCS